MFRINSIKKTIKVSAIILTGIFVVLLGVCIGHIVSVNRFNSQTRQITPESITTEAIVDIHPRGQATDPWMKENTGLGYKLNAKIYELVLTNNSLSLMSDWSLRINIHEECFLNNGWCGKFEVHQFGENGEEKQQTVDLRDYNVNDLEIDYTLGGQDLLIPLKSGDYVIYHPDDSGVSGEVPLKSTGDFSGMAVCGFIFYSRSGNVDFMDYVLDYKLYQSYFSGRLGRLFIVMFPLWGIAMLFLGMVFMLSVRYEERFLAQERLLGDTFKLCGDLADSKDYYSKGHSGRVAKYSRMIAERLGMDKSDCDQVYNAAYLHNIGNSFVPAQILRKGGKLTSEEYEIVKKHTTKGAEIAKELKGIPYIVAAVNCHHERYDGTGYPEGRKEDIPLIARIIAVADAYDAMSNDRPYRQKFIKEQIREEFIKNRGTQFDPKIVGVFLDIMGEREL